MEIEKFATTNRGKSEAMAFLTAKYEKILDLEDCGLAPVKNKFGIEIHDLRTLKSLTSGNPGAVSSLAHWRALDWGAAAGIASLLPTCMAPFAVGWGGALEAFVLSVPPLAMIGGVVVIAGGVSYGLTRYKATDYFQLKQQQVRSWN